MGLPRVLRSLPQRRTLWVQDKRPQVAQNYVWAERVEHDPLEPAIASSFVGRFQPHMCPQHRTSPWPPRSSSTCARLRDSDSL